MYITPRVFLLGVIDEVMRIALHRPIATGGVGIQSAPRLHGEVRRLLHRLDGKVPRRVDHNPSLAADPGDDVRAGLVIMAPAGLALLAAPTRAAAQRLLPTLFGLPLVARGVGEVIRLHRAFELAIHLIGQGGITEPPAPPRAGPDMHPQLPGN